MKLRKRIERGQSGVGQTGGWDRGREGQMLIFNEKGNGLDKR